MDNLQEIQDLWQHHSPGMSSNNDKSSNAILEKIKHTEKDIFRKNILKTIVVGILSIYFIWMLNQLESTTIFTWIGVGTIVLSIITMMIIYWKIQFKSSNLKHSLPQNEFIDDTIHQMKKHKKQFIRLFKWFVLVLVAGINLLYLDLLKGLPLNHTIAYHLGVSLFLLLVGFLGLKIREKRFNKEFKPLINELESNKE